MVFLINPDAPKVAQVVKAIRKELPAYDYQYVVLGCLDPKIADDFIFPDIKTVFVHDAETERLSQEEIEELYKNNVIYVDGERKLHNMYHSHSHRFRSVFPAEIMAATIKNLDKSVQKCVEIAVTAVDKKAIPAGKRIISIAGENEEPDTAIVIEPSFCTRMIDTNIVKIICHPYHKDW